MNPRLTAAQVAFLQKIKKKLGGDFAFGGEKKVAYWLEARDLVRRRTPMRPSRRGLLWSLTDHGREVLVGVR